MHITYSLIEIGRIRTRIDSLSEHQLRREIIIQLLIGCERIGTIEGRTALVALLLVLHAKILIDEK